MMKKAPYGIPKSKEIRVIIDTDCHCEADDQFAVAHLLMTPKFDVVGITAEHYAKNFGATSVADSMQQSFDEAQLIVDLMGLHDQVKVYPGCTEQLPDDKTPVNSAATDFIIQEAMKDDPRPLFVTMLGATTNLASALLKKPEIAHRITTIWIGGGAYPEGNYEFNTINDVNAANAVMDSNVELWQVPITVYSTMKVGFMELWDKVHPYGKLGKHLVEYMMEFNDKFVPYLSEVEQWKPKGISEAAFRAMYPGGENWQLGDSPVVGLMLTDHEGSYTVEGAPRFEIGTCRYILRPGNPRQIRVYSKVDVRFILDDFFSKIKYYFGD